MKDELPSDLRQLDRTLRAVRFEPRASLGAEIGGRIRRGDTPSAPGAPSRRLWLLAAAAGILTPLGLAVWQHDAPAPAVSLDRCCYDLDGGGKADDGLHVVAGEGEQVRRVAIYEDLDGSTSFTPEDLIRYQAP